MIKIIYLLLSFLLSVFLVALTAAAILKATVWNPGYLKEQIEFSGYAEGIASELSDVYISLGHAGGFSEEFMTSLLAEDRIKKDLGLKADELYNKAAQTDDLSEYRGYISGALLDNIKERGIRITPEIEGAVDNMASICANEYKSKLILPLFAQVSGIIGSLEKTADIAFWFSFALCVLVAALLVFTNIKKPRDICRYLVYSLTSAGIVILLPSLLLKFSGRIERLAISNEAAYMLLTKYLSGMLTRLCLSAAFIAAAAVLLLLIYNYLGIKRRRNLTRSTAG